MEVITVWGSPGGGKTTLSLELAKKISEETKENVALIFTEDQASPLAYLFPSLSKDGGSLGKIITMAGFDQEELLKTLVNHPKNKCLAFLGYRNGDTKLSYPEVVEAQVIDLFVTLGQKFKYAIIDGQSDFHNDWITQYGLRYGKCVTVGGGDLKSIAFFSGTISMLQDFPGFRDTAIRVLNNPWDFDTWRLIGDKYGGVTHAYPYCMDIQKTYLEGTSIKPPKTSKRNQEFMDEISELSQTLIEDKEKDVKKEKSRYKMKRSKKKDIKKNKAPKRKRFTVPFRKVKEETE
jgi:hypothetical protein